jgi:hypothetical protein
MCWRAQKAKPWAGNRYGQKFRLTPGWRSLDKEPSSAPTPEISPAGQATTMRTSRDLSPPEPAESPDLVASHIEESNNVPPTAMKRNSQVSRRLVSRRIRGGSGGGRGGGEFVGGYRPVNF